MSAVDTTQALTRLWREALLPEAALGYVRLTGSDPVVPSSFAVGAAAQTAISSAALAAAELRYVRTGRRQDVTVDARDAAIECYGRFTIDGVEPSLWEKYSGLYPCGSRIGEPGFVRIHANFAHHRDGALRLLGLPEGEVASKEEVAAALSGWRALDFEEAAADRGLVVAALRTPETWAAHPQGLEVAALPTLTIEKIGEAQACSWPAFSSDCRPLSGLRVLELTRILAGPVAGRTLAAYGADVMLVNSPRLPNIDAIKDTSRGKLSSLIDLDTESGRAELAGLVRGAHVFIQGYRPGGIAERGFSPEDLARLRPGIVAVSLSAYSHVGPWAGRRGFDSLVQTTTGFNHSEGEAFGGGQRALPVQLLDYCTGFLIAFGAQAALFRQAREGGSWHVRVSLAQTAQWVKSFGRVPHGTAASKPEIDSLLQTYQSGFGVLQALPHAARFSETPWAWTRPSVPPGTNPPAWPT